ncbi:MAG: DUF1287 domain-containing protein [Pseudorhodobacter sp.]|nr:MAG: DUF1287 domain-containing protein [Pseudorhodobacter sp.]
MKFLFAGLALVIAAAALLSPLHLRVVVAQAVAAETLAASPEAQALIRAAEGQVGVTTSYDPAYVALEFPGGDVAADRGVCTDVVIRALRVAHGIDLQAAVNRDMKGHFAAYPKTWGLKTTDRNIDHRRVPNLQTFLSRMGAEVTGEFEPGDIVTTLLPGNLPHILIVTDRRGASGPMIVHNIGAGTRVEDRLFEFPHTGHYRLTPEVLARMRALAG